MLRRISCALILFCALSGKGLADDTESADRWTTRSGFYVVSFSSELTPLSINKIHNWVFHIETSSGAAVEDATISITGGMPEHNHGLPTSPRMTQSLGDGNYLLSGMRFHMHGKWELNVTIDAGDRRDTVKILVTI